MLLPPEQHGKNRHPSKVKAGISIDTSRLVSYPGSLYFTLLASFEEALITLESGNLN